MKRFISLSLIFILVFTAAVSAYAVDTTHPVDDPIISEIVASGSLTFSGTTANCSGSVTDPGKSIVATMTLSRGSTVVGSWSGSGTSYVVLNGSCTVTKGLSYTLVISGTVDGVSFSTTPITKTC